MTQASLPALPAEAGGVGFAHRCRSAAHDAPGGDLYDVAPGPAGIRLIIGDVKGSGPAAAGLAAAVLRAFRQNAPAAVGLTGLARVLDDCVSRELEPEDFVTVVLAEFGDGEVRLANCGHPAPLRIGVQMESLIPPRRSPPIGLRPDPVLQRARLGAGERILFYTDGLAEARDRDGQMFRLDERARTALTAPLLDDAADELLQLALSHAGGQLRDDLALVLAQPSGRPCVRLIPRRLRRLVG
jgi:phosphoserine phosphatase RsbU/P